jgi:hypothetical protein
MSHIESNLLAGEAVAYRTRLHWILFTPGVVSQRTRERVASI